MALAIDWALLALVHFCLSLLTASQLLKATLRLEPLEILTLYCSSLVLFFGSFVFLHMVYFTIFHAWSGQSIGKMIMGIKVVTKDGKIISLAVAFLRWTGYIMSFVPLAAGFLWAAVDKDHCTWHDKLTQTRVVTAEMT